MYCPVSAGSYRNVGDFSVADMSREPDIPLVLNDMSGFVKVIKLNFFHVDEGLKDSSRGTAFLSLMFAVCMGILFIVRKVHPVHATQDRKSTRLNSSHMSIS